MNESKQHLSDLFGLVKNDLAAFNKSSVSRKRGKSAEESIEFAEAALREGDPKSAVRHYERAIEQGSRSARIDLAAAHEILGEDEEAEKLYKESLDQDRDQAEPRAGLSDILRRSAHFREAVQELHHAIAKEPNNPHYHFKLSELLKEMKLLKEATNAAERAALCEPDNAFYHLWLAEVLIERKLFSDALIPLEAAVNLSPGDDHLYLRAAAAFWGADKSAEATKALKLAVELSPDNALYPALLDLVGDGSRTKLDALDPYDRNLADRWIASIDFDLPSRL